MSDEKRDGHDSMDEDLMNKFLDGLLTESEAQAFLASCDDPDLLRREKELQSSIDDSLKRVFSFDSLDVETIEAQWLKEKKTSTESMIESEAGTKVDLKEGSTSANPNARQTNAKRPNAKRLEQSKWVKLAVAASLFFATGLMIWQFNGSSNVQTAFFEPTPLTEVYSETVDRGFSPYYLCDDPQRFADEFEHRQGQPLALASLPDGSRMLGISHLGGISRTTTAMLCEVDNQKVLVFVDTEANDQREIVMANDNPDLSVFVTTKRGLVFYEVSPLSHPRMIKHFEFVD